MDDPLLSLSFENYIKDCLNLSIIEIKAYHFEYNYNNLVKPLLYGSRKNMALECQSAYFSELHESTQYLLVFA